MHGDAGKKDWEETVKRTEAKRAPLVAVVQSAFVPVTLDLERTPEN